MALALLTLTSLLLPTVSAHGHVIGGYVDGKWFRGWDAELKYQNPIPPNAGWQADNLDNGFISPTAFASADIICHKSAKNANSYVEAKAGSKVVFVWNTWPVSHKGPVFDYIAPCDGECTTVSAASLKFTKFKQGAWISGNDPGAWVTDDLVKANNSWTTTIPSGLAPGNYVIRHEIIALHAAGQANGAQAYPQCLNFKITAGGAQTLSGGVSATTFYKATDPGIKFDLYSKFTGYTIPGPALASLKKREEREHAKDWME